MTVTYYASGDASAPSLDGQTGSLNTVLEAILVNGYGSKAAAGWTKPYSDATTKTNVYLPAAGTGFYLQVQDNGPGAGSFREARVRGYETMSAYNTGSGLFPTSAQKSTGLFVRKSNTLDAVVRAWRCAADTKGFIFQSDDGSGGAAPDWFSFGDFLSWKAADAYACLISARFTENTTTQSITNTPNNWSSYVNSAFTSCYLARSYSGVGSAVAATLQYNAALLQLTTNERIGIQGITYPNPVDGGILLSPLYLGEGTYTRGRLRGLWQPAHVKPIIQDDTFSATDGALTRSFRAINIGSAGQALLETSDTWDNE